MASFSCNHNKCKIAREKNLERIGFIAVHFVDAVDQMGRKTGGKVFERVLEKDKDIAWCDFDKCLYEHFRDLLIHCGQTHLTGAGFYKNADAMLMITGEKIREEIYDYKLRISYRIDLFEIKKPTKK